MNVIGIVGWKNSGKTGLVVRLVSALTRCGLTISTLKRAHHQFELDRSGSDSFRHRAAGAQEVIISSQRRWAIMHENNGNEADLTELLVKLEPVDLVIVEGFKKTSIPKIEVRHQGVAGMSIAATDSTVIAVASDQPATEKTPPEFNSDDDRAIASFILDYFGYKKPNTITNSDYNVITEGESLSAMPPGIDWMPVDEVLEVLKKNMSVVTEVEEVEISNSVNRILAQDLWVERSSPPAANSAVDGFGFDFDSISNNNCRLQLMSGRAVAGQHFDYVVPKGHAVRILTGAILPNGVDTIVLDEFTRNEFNHIVFKPPHRRGANTRLRGEDLLKGDLLFSKGRLVKSCDLASLAAAGISSIPVHRPLKVAVISTGNEIVSEPIEANINNVIDTNRKMLSSILIQWGYVSVDMGIVPDEVAAVRDVLDRAAELTDAILITGGASSGDEDHVAKLLLEKSQLLAWRVAIKPGRPLALARWKDTPIFGLPGNPVAAFVCALVFARPALSLLAGGRWFEPAAFAVAANFEKIKKKGRREYIRAKLNENGLVDAFRSEGSGLTAGLAWSDGLVELSDEAQIICAGGMVRYIPYSSFGL